VRFLACDMPEANDLTVGLMALVAEQERDAISKRTKEALAAAKARGICLGNPSGAAVLRRPGQGGTALDATVAANADTFARTLAALQANGHTTLRALAAELNAWGPRLLSALGVHPCRPRPRSSVGRALPGRSHLML
jgi:DNA invertase Pin-like site-specific DNA recombinase